VIGRFRSWAKADRVGGVVWVLSVLWVGIGAAASGYVFLVSTQTVLDPTSPFGGLFDWPAGELSESIAAICGLAAVAWLVLTVPVLIAGIRQLLGCPNKWVRTAAWAGAWAAGLALTALIPFSLASPPPPQGYSGGPIANWQELVISAGFLTLAAVMAWILARPAQPRGEAIRGGPARSSGP
jgi:hypothetical protein